MLRSALAMQAASRTDEDRLLCFRTSDPILASDDQLRVVLWNAGAEALLGYTEADALGRRCCELLGCRSGARPGCGGGCAEEDGLDPLELVPSFDREVCRKDGSKVWVNVTTILATTRGGETVLVHLLRDLTRQKEIEELLQRVVSSAVKLSRLSAPATPVRAARPDEVDLPCASVTLREREVIRLLAQGASTHAIAARLGIGHRTARNHIQNILGKLGAHSRLEAVARASNQGLV